MSLKEKAAWVLDTPATASNDQCAASVSVTEKTDDPTPRDFRTLQAMLAQRGEVLQRIWHAGEPAGSFLVATRLGAHLPFPDIEGVQHYLDALKVQHD